MKNSAGADTLIGGILLLFYAGKVLLMLLNPNFAPTPLTIITAILSLIIGLIMLIRGVRVVISWIKK